MDVLQSFQLTGKRALITGSSAGIGLALARALGQAGAHVVLNGRTAAKVAQACEALRAEGLSASWRRRTRAAGRGSACRRC